MGKYLIAGFAIDVLHPLGVDGNHDALRAKAFCSVTHQLGIVDSRRIDADFVCASVKHGADVLQCADATTHSQRNKHVLGDLLYRVDGSLATFMAGGDIQESNFIGSLLIVANGNFHGVTRIADIDEVDTLDHTAVFDIQAGDNAFRQRH